MNAKHLTLICSSSALLLTNYMLTPAWRKHQQLSMDTQQAQAAVQIMQARMAAAQALPTHVMNLSDRTVALSSAVNAWTSSSRDYGITLTQIATSQHSMGKNVVEVSALAEVDSLTGLPVQRLTLKGQYQSLTDFQRYLAQEMNPEQAVTIEQLKLAGDTFELGVVIYSRT